jgi:hypothetical protein
VQSHSWVRCIDRGSFGSLLYQMPTPLYIGVKGASFLPARNMCHLISCRPYPLPSLFHMGLDLVGPFKKPKGRFTHIFIAVDKFTKWVEAKPATSIVAAKAIEFVKEIMYRFDVPNNIITNNGTQFTAREFKYFCVDSNIKVSYASVSCTKQRSGRTLKWHDPIGLEP